MTARYRMPVCAASEDDDLPISNADLPKLAFLELWAEGERVQAALAQATADYASGRHVLPGVYGHSRRLDGREWLRQRLQAADAELKRRESAAMQALLDNKNITAGACNELGFRASDVSPTPKKPREATVKHRPHTRNRWRSTGDTLRRLRRLRQGGAQ